MYNEKRISAKFSQQMAWERRFREFISRPGLPLAISKNCKTGGLYFDSNYGLESGNTLCYLNFSNHHLAQWTPGTTTSVTRKRATTFGGWRGEEHGRGKRRGDLDLGQGDKIKVSAIANKGLSQPFVVRTFPFPGLWNLSTLLVGQYIYTASKS